MGNELEKYIMRQREKGFSDNLIKEKLINNKYPKKYVDNFFLKLKFKKIISITLGILIIFLILVVFIFTGKFFLTLNQLRKYIRIKAHCPYWVQILFL